MLTTISSKRYLGIDAGGTHTEAIITDESGFVLGRSVLEYGTNPHNTSPEASFQAVLKAANSARENARFTNPDCEPDRTFDVVCIGMAGFDTDGDRQNIKNFLARLPSESPFFTCKRLIIVNNGLIALLSGSEKSSGICISVGTGSSCYGITTDGREAIAGGWGYFLGDQGSGYWIGRALVRQVMREYDGRVAPSLISAKVLEKLNLGSADELVDWSYKNGRLPIIDTARLSSLLNDPELEDCVAVSKIIDQSVTDISEAYMAVSRKLVVANIPDATVVLTGGLFKMKGNFQRKTERFIRDYNPNVNVITATSMTPAQGAIRLIQNASQGDMLPKLSLVIVNPTNQ